MVRKSKSNLKSTLGLALILVLIVLFSAFNYRIIKSREGNEEKIKDMRARLNSLQEEKQALRTNLDETDDRAYIERVLREDFLMKKPGEKKVVILLDEEKEKVVNKSKTQEKTYFEKLKALLPFVE